jgi:hypothetical protein
METKSNWPTQENSQQKGYEEFLYEIEKNLDNPEKLKSWIENRLTELKNKSEPLQIGFNYKRWYSDFIHPESETYRSMWVDPFRVDDDSLYEEMISVMKDFKDNPSWKDKPLRSMMPYVIQHTIVKYFGNLTANGNTEANNQEFYRVHSVDESFPAHISLGELKEKRIAVCAEKASVAQNLTTVLGLESNLVMSSNCKLLPEEKEELHAFNIWRTKKGYFIFDPTNPMLKIEKETNTIKSYNPAIYPISEDEFKKIKDGGVVSVQNEDIFCDSKGDILEKKLTERIYGGPN